MIPTVYAGVVKGAPSGPSGPSLPIDWATVLASSFSRASAATYWDGTTFTRYTSGTARILGDGSLYVEGARTNTITQSDDYATANVATRTANDALAPDGAMTADRRLATGGGGRAINPAQTLLDATTYTMSVWAKHRAGDTGNVLRWAAQALTESFDATASWVRFVGSNLMSGTNTGEIRVQEQGAADDSDIWIWGWQVEQGAFPSQHIETSGTAATRLADDAYIASADVPAAMFSGAFKVTIKPRRASTELNDDPTSDTLFAYGSGTNNRIYIDGSNRIAVRVGGVTVAVTGALTWSADQAITLTFDAAAGEVIVSGATTGNGTTTGTAWAYTPADVQIGATTALGRNFFGGISPPVAP